MAVTQAKLGVSTVYGSSSTIVFADACSASLLTVPHSNGWSLGICSLKNQSVTHNVSVFLELFQFTPTILHKSARLYP